MATRFYTHPFHEPTETFTPDGAWDFAVNHDVRRMYPYRNGFEIVNKQTNETTATANLDTLLAQFVSPPLTTQTITGTFHGAMMARESASGGDFRSQTVVRVIAEDGTVRGTLISASTASLSNEWVASTTGWRNARFPVGSSGASVTSVNAVAGDRIVVEVGFRAHNSSAGTFTGTVRYGNGATNTDLPSNDTQTTSTTNNPWFEFSQTLTFDVTEYDIYDDIADAVDAIPDPLTERLYRADLTAYTQEPDDPAQLQFDYSPFVVTGWIRMDAPADGPALLTLLAPGGGHESWPLVWSFDEVPDSASSTGFLFPYDNENPAQLLIPAGEFRYLAVGTDPTWAGTVSEVFLIARRVDAGAPTGDIVDDIADAVDVFPSSMGTETESETTNLTYFTTEADDPTETETFTGNNLAYTGWLKLVVPTDALVTISVIDPTDEQDLVFFLYDETPTASSVAVFESDDDNPVPSFAWPYLPEITLVAGTYYLLVIPYNMDTWDVFAGGQVTVRVRWEFAPVVEDFSLDAIVKRLWAPPNEPVQPTQVGTSTTATVDSDDELTISLPSGIQDNDLLVVALSWDRGGLSSTSTTVLVTGDEDMELEDVSSGASLGTDHRLNLWSYRYFGSSTSLTFQTRNGTTLVGVATAKAGAVTAWRNAGEMEVLGTQSNSLYTQGSHATGNFGPYLSTADNYGDTLQYMAVWAGANTGAGRWDLLDSFGPDATEIFDATAASNANIAGIVWNERKDYIESQQLEPRNVSDNSLRSEPNMNAAILIHGNVTSIFLSARIGPGFFFNAVIQAATHTTHPRTGPHTGTHLDTAVVTSAMLGSLPAGTDLHTVLVDLDAMLTDLENQE